MLIEMVLLVLVLQLLIRNYVFGEIWSTTACAWPGTWTHPRGIPCMTSKYNFWGRVGFVPTVSHVFSCPIVSPQFPSLDMFLGTILSLHLSHSALSASLLNGVCFPFPFLLLYDFLLVWPCYLQ